MSGSETQTRSVGEDAPDAGAIFDAEISRLSADQDATTPHFLTEFFKLLDGDFALAGKHSPNTKRLSYITLHGPRDDFDKEFLAACRKDFITAVELGKIQLTRQE